MNPSEQFNKGVEGDDAVASTEESTQSEQRASQINRPNNADMPDHSHAASVTHDVVSGEANGASFLTDVTGHFGQVQGEIDPFQFETGSEVGQFPNCHECSGSPGVTSSFSILSSNTENKTSPIPVGVDDEMSDKLQQFSLQGDAMNVIEPQATFSTTATTETYQSLDPASESAVSVDTKNETPRQLPTALNLVSEIITLPSATGVTENLTDVLSSMKTSTKMSTSITAPSPDEKEKHSPFWFDELSDRIEEFKRVCRSFFSDDEEEHPQESHQGTETPGHEDENIMPFANVSSRLDSLSETVQELKNACRSCSSDMENDSALATDERNRETNTSGLDNESATATASSSVIESSEQVPESVPQEIRNAPNDACTDDGTDSPIGAQEQQMFSGEEEPGGNASNENNQNDAFKTPECEEPKNSSLTDTTLAKVVNDPKEKFLSAEQIKALKKQLEMPDTLKEYLFTDTVSMDIQRLLADAITCKAPLPDIERILAAGAEVNVPVSKGLKPLHYAAYINDATYVTFLLDRGAHVNTQDDVGYTPLHLCARHGHYETMQILIDNGAIVNFCDGGLDIPEGLQTIGYLTLEPLNLAIENNNVDCVRLLLEHGANPENQYILGTEINLVPLEYTKCLELLLMYGANPNVFSRSGITPIMKACKERQPDALKLLIEYGADVNMQCPPRFEQKTALHIAILVGCMEMVQILVEAGASLKRPENFRGGALNTAVVHGRPEVCRYLIKHGADVNEPNEEDCPPLLVACAASRLRNRQEIIQLLLENGANHLFYNERISYAIPGLTPLVEYLANAEIPEYEIVHLLVKHGARVHFKIPTKMLRLLDPYGVLKHLVSIQTKPNILNLLVEAAECYDTEKILRDRSYPEMQRAILSSACVTPASLKHQSRIIIRRHLYELPISNPIKQLPLPPLLKSYLLFE
ncbi:ankyrin repeat and KH domain-containing protein mask-like [Lingula anatina]|uniref:Ankyrin repeat and KH domain-containing protein mask-like n=1 Tax=Lingula anatina TaxID=7574 RepID=A0A1S3K0D6_LINAN|nr:ankyrin repeat and KH domain-containing protein mask-like [Lingula anatina]XP_013415737.1 ankyrin repeat and KH domain-containing protein mask-like [Lingula anatina]|eukprot:XP_013415736.1 ankyrin repeat and KH domain-containing protein mask-like [Lingula anatina]